MLDACCWMLDAGCSRLDLVLLRLLILHDIVFLSEILDEDLVCGKGLWE